MGYRLKILCFFVNESLKEYIKKETDERKKCKIMRKNQWERSSLRCYCVFQVIILEN